MNLAWLINIQVRLLFYTIHRCPNGLAISHLFVDMLATGDCLVHNLIDVGQDQRTNLAMGANHRTIDTYFNTTRCFAE
jgi:hypothetical protein